MYFRTVTRANPNSRATARFGRLSLLRIPFLLQPLMLRSGQTRSSETTRGRGTCRRLTRCARPWWRSAPPSSLRRPTMISTPTDRVPVSRRKSQSCSRSADLRSPDAVPPARPCAAASRNGILQARRRGIFRPRRIPAAAGRSRRHCLPCAGRPHLAGFRSRPRDRGRGRVRRFSHRVRPDLCPKAKPLRGRLLLEPDLARQWPGARPLRQRPARAARGRLAEQL
jgi:hypothetical protein